ncbi:unnamed protein product [Rhodiola kirilowii]
MMLQFSNIPKVSLPAIFKITQSVSSISKSAKINTSLQIHPSSGGLSMSHFLVLQRFASPLLEASHPC